MTLVKLGAASAALAVAGVFLWGLDRPAPSDPLRAADRPAQRAALAEAPAAPVEVVPLVEAPPRVEARAGVEAAPEDAASRTVTAIGSAPLLALVDARFVDAQGIPWQGVKLSALGPAREREGPRVLASALSGADGLAQLEVAQPSYVARDDVEPRWRFDLLAERAGCATVKLSAVLQVGAVAHLGEVVLRPGGRVLGRVVDAQGLAVPGARVGPVAPEGVLPGRGEDELRLRRLGAEAFDPDLACESALDGTFVLAGVAPGAWRLWAHAPGMRYGWSEPLEVLAGGDLVGVELVLAPLVDRDRISGFVVGPQGAPCQARIHCISRHGGGSRMRVLDTDPEGHFEVLVESADAVFEFTAFDGLRRWTPRTVRDVEPGRQDVEIRFEEDRDLLVHVRDEEGRTVEGASFKISLSHTSYDGEHELVAPGDYAVACPPGGFALELEAPGFRDARRGPFREGAVPSELEVVLERAPRVRGWVVADGAPLAGAKVELRAHNPEARQTVNGARCVYSSFARAQARSDAEGRFELDGDVEGAFWLRAELEGWAPGELGPLELGALDEPLEVQLTRGGAIEGFVVVPADQSAAGRIVVFNHGDGAPRSVRTAPDGSFRLEGLAPGPWQVFARESEIDPHSWSYAWYEGDAPLEWSCHVEAGATTRFDLDLTR